MHTTPESSDTTYDFGTKYKKQNVITRLLLDSFFAAKNSHVVADTMAHFSPDVVTYTESILGWPLDGYETIEQTFAQRGVQIRRNRLLW